MNHNRLLRAILPAQVIEQVAKQWMRMPDAAMDGGSSDVTPVTSEYDRFGL